MKVKKFRIKPRLSVVGRIYRELVGAKKLAEDVEGMLPLEVSNYSPHILPSAMYQTWSHNEYTPQIEALLQAAGLSDSIAVSIIVATIGTAIEEELSKLLLKGDTVRAQIFTAFSEESADLSYQFISKLLVEDASHDDCEITDPVFVKDTEQLGTVFSLLDMAGEGIGFDQGGHLTPRFTRVCLVGWNPVSKKKKAAILSKRRFS